MKRLQDFKKLPNRYIPDKPIHFKFSMGKEIIQRPVHENFDTRPHINDWIKQNDNTHLSKHPDNEEASREITQKLLDHAPEISKESHKDTLIRYSGGGSTDLNNMLHERHGKATQIPSYHRQDVSNLDDLTKNPIGVGLSVYSGLGFNPKEKMNKDSKVLLPAFTSATHDKKTAEFFSTVGKKNYEQKNLHIVHIRLQPDDWAAHISHHSSSPNEHETVIARDTELKFHPTPKIYKNEHGDNVHIWDAHIHNQY